MSDTTNQQSAGGYALLARFAWGNGGDAAYTTWSEPITVAGITYVPEPRLEAEAAKQTGAVKDEPWTVTMPAGNAPFASLARPSAYPVVTCVLTEIDPTATVQSPVVLWQGQVTQVWYSLRDKPGCARVEVGGVRTQIQWPLGIESKSQCSRVFGDPWCGVNLAAVNQSATITAVSGRLLSAPSLTIPSGRPANYWSFGRVLVNGLSLGIVDGSGGVGSLYMGQQPPPEWVGATGLFYPGCDKSFGGSIGCTGWGNTARHFGIGAVKPSGSPVLTPR
jgi:hypothetical protein